jgi:hypothetical protein
MTADVLDTHLVAYMGLREALGFQIRAEKRILPEWLLLDSRVVDVPMASNPTFVTLFSLKPFFFKALKMRCDSRTTLEHKPPESNKSVRPIGWGLRPSRLGWINSIP